jgi:hypothetical protein
LFVALTVQYSYSFSENARLVRSAQGLPNHLANVAADIKDVVSRFKSGKLPSASAVPNHRRTDYCANFNSDFSGVLYDFNNAGNGYMASYPAGCGFNDILQLAKTKTQEPFKKACSTSGAASSTSCGSTGFYAKASGLVAKFNGMLASNCNVTGQMTIGGFNHTFRIASANDVLGNLGQITGMYCVSKGGEYCWPKYESAFAGKNFDKPTDDQLKSVCTDCTNAIMEATFVAAGGSPEAKKGMMSFIKAMDALCTKVNGAFCYPPMQKAMDKPDGQFDAESAKFMCENPCGPVMNAKFMEFDKMEGKDVSFKEARVTSQCYKNGNTYCAEYVENAGKKATNHWTIVSKSTSCAVPANGPDTKPFPANPTACSGTCKTDFSALVASSGWGCCYPSLLAATNKAFQDYMTAQATQCGTAVPKVCDAGAGAKPVSFQIDIANLKYSYSSAAGTKDKVMDAVTADVAMNIGVPPKLCKSTKNVANVNGGSRFSVECKPPTAIQTGNMAAMLDQYVPKRRSSSSMTMGQTATLPASAKVDPAAAVGGTVPTKASCGGTCPSNNLNNAGTTKTGPGTTPTPAAASGAASNKIGAVFVGLLFLHMLYAN